jgi:para-aminobenzoate synthetase component 1
MLVEEYPFIEPDIAFGALAGSGKCQFLDSGNDAGFSYIALNPIHIITARDGQVCLDGVDVPGSPFTVLGTLMAQYEVPHDATLPPFQGGLVGYFGYDLCQQLENLPEPEQDWINIPDLMAGIYDVVLSFDLAKRRMWIIAHGFCAPESQAQRMRAREKLADIKDLLRRAMPFEVDVPQAPELPAMMPWQANFNRADYEDAVRRVLDYIFAGDIFQANLSQSFFAHYGLGQMPDRFALYRRLRGLSPAPFGAYLDFGAVAILSNSPERFLKVDADGRVETKPIKGTRPRGNTPLEDAANAQELLCSDKDRAENVMIVDLLRNDLSKVCEPYSVVTKAICQLESFANVHHLVSTVEGRLETGKTAIDALAACFPGGSITGAPKIRAMEIITELENSRRGAYCGAIGFIGFDGAMDTNIAIRTLSIHEGRMAFNVGGGIVADSIPACEYDETLSKAAKLIAALGIVTKLP